MDTLPLWLLAVIFVAGAAVIWVAGIQLSKTTDVLDSRAAERSLNSRGLTTLERSAGEAPRVRP